MPRSWAAWVMAFLLERVALALLASEVVLRPGTRAAALELAELARRRSSQWWALETVFIAPYQQRNVSLHQYTPYSDPLCRILAHPFESLRISLLCCVGFFVKT